MQKAAYGTAAMRSGRIFSRSEAYPVCAVRNTGKRAMNQPERVRLAIKISNGEFAFFHQLHIIESVRLFR